jgi:rRNA-processing protein FCF1
MKIKKLKRTRKALVYFQTVHGIRPPYTVLVDGTFIQASIVQRIAIKDELAKVLGAKVVVAVTEGIVKELRLLGEPFASAAIVARRLERIRLPDASSRVISDIILSAVSSGNPQKLCIATEDEALQARVRQLDGVPLIRISRGAIVIERKADTAGAAPVNQAPRLPPLPTKAPRIVKRKRTASPNPLSCKPRKAKMSPAPPAAAPRKSDPSQSAPSASTAAASQQKRKRQRRRSSKAHSGADGSAHGI